MTTRAVSTKPRIGGAVVRLLQNRASTRRFDGLNRPAYQVPDQSCDCHRGTTTEEHSTGSYYLVTAADVRTNRTRYRQGDE
jgi:hypothetical protein